MASGIPVTNDLLAHVYGSAVDDTKWVDFCEALSDLSGAKVLLYGHHLTENQGLGALGGGFDPVELKRHEADFADKNPWMHMNVALPVGLVGVSDQALSQRDLFKTDYYNGWLRHQEDIIGGPAMICHRSPEKFVAIALACRAKGYEDKVVEAQSLLQALSPHLIRAIAFSTALREVTAPSALLADAFEHGIIALTRSGHVGHVNRAASRFLDRCSALSITPSQRLTMRDGALQSFIKKTHDAVAAMDCRQLPAPAKVSMDGGSLVMLHAHLFPEQAELAFPTNVWADPIAGAIVIAGANDLADRSYADLARGLGATAAEARLAEALLGGESLYDYADRRGLSRHTVRNQMRALLLKSGTRNQTDFMRTMLHLASPLRSFES